VATPSGRVSKQDDAIRVQGRLGTEMFNWDTRYANLLNLFRAELESGSVLEVGCGPQGIARYLKARVKGLEVVPVQPEAKNLEIVQGSIEDIPFPDGAFDYVVCSDVLEHLPAQIRAKAIAEIIRVANRKCFIQGPHGKACLAMEKTLSDVLRRRGFPDPPWLQEHIANGLPEAGETIFAVVEAGFLPSVRKNEGIVEHYATVLLDLFFSELWSMQANAARKGLLAEMRCAEADEPYSLFVTVDKSRVTKEIADPFRNGSGAFTRELARKRETADPETTIYSVHHTQTDLAARFCLLKVFDVTGRLPDADVRLREPVGFFEERNDRCSEMSAIHYVWRRRLFGDVVGFCHYRRYLHLWPEEISAAEIKVDVRQLITLLPRIEDEARIHELLGQFDLLTSRPEKLGGLSQAEQYARACFCDDYFVMVECILERYPFLAGALSESMSDTSLYSTNMLICGGELFDAFCRVWFDILEGCAEKLDPAGRNTYQTRDIAFLSERVFDTLIRHLKRLGYRIAELPRVFVASWDAAETEPPVSRNQPCPCGSGKRYKHCCGVPD